MKAYQLSKTRTHYWWTGTIDCESIPSESFEYLYIGDKKLAEALSGTRRKN